MRQEILVRMIGPNIERPEQPSPVIKQRPDHRNEHAPQRGERKRPRSGEWNAANSPATFAAGVGQDRDDEIASSMPSGATYEREESYYYV